ncbi:hypothetical protein JHK85_004123 [Glycine max]|nr:hypothetical protein JHK85_004123 [Glycine max]
MESTRKLASFDLVINRTRMESISIKCVHGLAKILGSVLSLAGAITFSLVKGPHLGFMKWYPENQNHTSHPLTIVHSKEETNGADRNGPTRIISAVGISITVGWGYIIYIIFAVTSIPYILSESNDAGGYAIAEMFYQAFKTRYGNGIGGIICLVLISDSLISLHISSLFCNSSLCFSILYPCHLYSILETMGAVPIDH